MRKILLTVAPALTTSFSGWSDDVVLSPVALTIVRRFEVENLGIPLADLIRYFVTTVKGHTAHKKTVSTQLMHTRATAARYPVIPQGSADAVPFKRFLVLPAGLAETFSMLMFNKNDMLLTAEMGFRKLLAHMPGTDNRMPAIGHRYLGFVKKFPLLTVRTSRGNRTAIASDYQPMPSCVWRARQGTCNLAA